MWIRVLSNLFSHYHHCHCPYFFMCFLHCVFLNLFFEQWPSRSLQVRPRSLPTPVAKEDWDQVGCTNRSSLINQLRCCHPWRGELDVDVPRSPKVPLMSLHSANAPAKPQLDDSTKKIVTHRFNWMVHRYFYMEIPQQIIWKQKKSVICKMIGYNPLWIWYFSDQYAKWQSPAIQGM